MPPRGDGVTKVLCVAEKPSIARAVANHLGGGQFNTVRGQRMVGPSNETDSVTAQYTRQRVRQKLRISIQLSRMGQLRGDNDLCPWPSFKP